MEPQRQHADTVYGAYSRISDQSQLRRNGNLVGLAYAYDLYAKTKPYASWGRMSNNDNGRSGLANGGDLVGNVTTTGVSPNGYMAGLNVSF